MNRNDLRVFDGIHDNLIDNLRPVHPEEFDAIARAEGYVKLPDRLVALDGIDVEALRSAHFMVKKQVDPAIPNRPSVLVGWDAEAVQTLIEQALAALEGEDTDAD